MFWEKITQGMYLMVIGMGVVFISLFLLMEFINTISWFDRLLSRIGKKKAESPVAEELQAGLTAEEVAVLSAAATEALAAKRVEIHDVHLLPDDNQDVWASMGRMDHLRSHNIYTPNK